MGIEISIEAGQNPGVKASGSIQHIITDTERKNFGITDGKLKDAVKAHFGKRPSDAYLHSPTPWGDLYDSYGWPQVQTVLIVDSATVMGITSQPVIVAKKTFKNNLNKRITCDCSITDTVTDTTESFWSETDTISVSQTIKYNVKFTGGDIGGSTTMAYEHSWGKGGSESKSVEVSTHAGLTVELEPGESVTSVLSASRGVMKVKVVYKAYLEGAVAVNYSSKYQGHHFWALCVGNVMRDGGISSSREFTEEIEIGYYSNATIHVQDSNENIITSLVLNAKPGMSEND